MTNRFADLMFTPTVKGVQETLGSRAIYKRLEGLHTTPQDKLTATEIEFLAERDSFYMATVSETGWPYVQHRGGPPGFLKVIDDKTIGFSDYPGNRQYVSVGNLVGDARVSLFLMNYPARRRLKILGTVRLIESEHEPALVRRLLTDGAPRVERGMVITVEAYDWNCPQYITPRFTEVEISRSIARLTARIQALEAENASLLGRV